MECLRTPACPSHICSFNRGNYIYIYICTYMRGFKVWICFMTECNCPEVILCSVCMHVCSGWKSGSVDAALIAWVSQESPSNWEGKLCLWFCFSTPWIGTWMVIEKQDQASLSERKVVNVVHYNRICFFYQSCAVSVFFLVAKFSVMTYIFPCSSCLA